MSNNRKDLNYKLKEFPLVRYNMLEHSVFERFLSMATKEQLEFCENFLIIMLKSCLMKVRLVVVRLCVV
nr:hypothetical protein CoNPh38_CDS0243 [Staphylococcus phage S-CoN_Ph38]